MSGSTPVKIVYGSEPLANGPPFDNHAYLAEVYEILQKHEVTEIDSSQIYGESEAMLGATKAGETFTLDTKWLGGGQPGWATKENIVNSAKESLKKLGVEQVDIFYIHLPDPQTPIADTLAGVQEVYQLGLFKRFGLCNYVPDDVRQIYNHCKEMDYVLPTVYQGIYSAVARRSETALFPTLKELGILFYAYSPLAGGFLAKTPEEVARGAGRFNDAAYGGMYKQWFVKPAYLEALKEWGAIASEEGCSRVELGYRWVVYHSPLAQTARNGMIVGARSKEQLEQALGGIAKGRVSDKACEAIDGIWEKVQNDAP
ncbi:uncharacterized protein PV07_00656 [Cladophialophora immunda]|uniref:NADP-dependent oxidoreductase domain-containing protein n=1 Tax=Cladophialophora immunda TaxID=569365 RepID=A0A0D2B873_9EURO|nr:uncharacterized protein PV07_00656 [Cladophialophora immunda]KIW33837.1 hypothetical protein PV07_00656 [Cladophialophora immunda]